MTSSLDNLHYALDAVREGKPVILLDDPDREGEGDLVIAAEHLRYNTMHFFLTYGSRIVCVPLPEERLHFLGLQPVAQQPTKPEACCLYTPVDSRYGGTGLGVADKLLVVQALLHDQVPASHHDSRLAIPGHTYPLRVHPQGLQGRRGHTEGSLALVRLAGCMPAAVITEVWDSQNNTPLQGPAISAFAQEHSLPLLHLDDLVSS